ncbi:hypothetical protein KF7_1576 [Lactococcus lactis subsp. lactis]|nr:hypothetical protein [Lactococcus lactis]KST84421.1 hypothetical protein KF7_1576 [Lactococcus lactis subsp. lactis]
MKTQTEKITQKVENEKSIKDNLELSTHLMTYSTTVLYTDVK